MRLPSPSPDPAVVAASCSSPELQQCCYVYVHNLGVGGISRQGVETSLLEAQEDFNSVGLTFLSWKFLQKGAALWALLLMEGC